MPYPANSEPITVTLEQWTYDDDYEAKQPVTTVELAQFAAAILVPSDIPRVEPIDPPHGIWSVWVGPNLTHAAEQYGLDVKIEFGNWIVTINLDPR